MRTKNCLSVLIIPTKPLEGKWIIFFHSHYLILLLIFMNICQFEWNVPIYLIVSLLNEFPWIRTCFVLWHRSIRTSAKATQWICIYVRKQQIKIWMHYEFSWKWMKKPIDWREIVLLFFVLVFRSLCVWESGDTWTLTHQCDE